MMVSGEYGYDVNNAKEVATVRAATVERVRSKFPKIIEGSTGWNRAYAAHFPKQLKRYRNGTR